MTHYPKLTGQVVVGTGVASGIGLAQAKAFLAQGCTFFGTDLAENIALTELKQTYPTNFFFYPCDIREKIAITHLVEFIFDHTDRVDILLNTAGILDAYTPSLETLPREQFEGRNPLYPSGFRPLLLPPQGIDTCCFA